MFGLNAKWSAGIGLALPRVIAIALFLLGADTVAARAAADPPLPGVPPEVPDGDLEFETEASPAAAPAEHEEVDPAVAEAPPPEDSWAALEILGAVVEPGTRRDLHWTAGQSFAGSAVDTPVVVVRGDRPGPALCLTAAVHGDELNGVEIVRRVLAGIDVEELAGTVIGVPIVNLLGFSRGSRYLPDRRDLNRYFPGHPLGSSASRIAYTFFIDVVRHCDQLVDFHTGSFKRTNLPQLRADLTVPAVREFVENFGATSVLHKIGARGTLRDAATGAGIPAVAFELGEPGTLQLSDVRFGVKAIDTLIDKLGMVERFSLWSEPQPIFYRSHWLRAYRGGILTSTARVGVRVNQGDVLGVVTNPLTNEETEILSPHDGRLLGRALNQFVLPGFATFHVGIETQDPGAPDSEQTPHELDHEGAVVDAGAITGGVVASPVVDGMSDDAIDEELH